MENHGILSWCKSRPVCIGSIAGACYCGFGTLAIVWILFWCPMITAESALAKMAFLCWMILCQPAYGIDKLFGLSHHHWPMATFTIILNTILGLVVGTVLGLIAKGKGRVTL